MKKCCIFLIVLTAIPLLLLFGVSKMMEAKVTGNLFLKTGDKAKVLREKGNGIPHIVAENQDIAVFTLGYIQA
jgi:acyl-homoserine lactone acylase PvdQ